MPLISNSEKNGQIYILSCGQQLPEKVDMGGNIVQCPCFSTTNFDHHLNNMYTIQITILLLVYQ